jgi:hypothetical protein
MDFDRHKGLIPAGFNFFSVKKEHVFMVCVLCGTSGDSIQVFTGPVLSQDVSCKR